MHTSSSAVWTSGRCRCTAVHHGTTAARSTCDRAWRPAPVRVCAAASSSSADSSSAQEQQQQQQQQQQQPVTYPYNSSDGRSQKAVLEHIFRPDAGGAAAAGASADRVQAPWSVGWQMSERNIMWNDELKLRLIKRVASQELHISEEELEERLQHVFNLLPDLADRLVKAPPKRVAELASSTDVIAARLLRLRQIFPKANASALVGNRLTLVLEEDLDEVAAAAARLRELLPNLLVDKLVECHPQVLYLEEFELALQDAKRLMPQLDVHATLRTNPELVLSFMKGRNLIPYDPAWPVQQQQQQAP